MKKRKKRSKKNLTIKEQENERIKSFLDMYLPGHVKIMSDYIIQDSKYRSIWVIKSYPQTTRDQALLKELGQMSGITLHVIAQQLNANEEEELVRNAANRSRMVVKSVNDTQTNIKAQQDFDNLDSLIRQLFADKQHLMKTTVFIEMSADTLEKLNQKEIVIQNRVQAMAITIDRLHDRQEQGFLSVMPGGQDMFKGEFSRALPQKSVANLYPFSYTGKADEHGFNIGRDTNGSYIFSDIFKAGNAQTNFNVLIMGNSGEGKSHLAKGLIINEAETGKNIIILDPEHEYEDLVKNLGGSYLNLLNSDYMINIFEPKTFTRPDDDESINAKDGDENYTRTYTTKGALSQHISFLRDFFKTYKPELSGISLDILEQLLLDLYEKEFHITNDTDMIKIPKDQFPTMHDLWAYAYGIYKNYNPDKNLFQRDELRLLLLKIQSICQGSQARYFDGHTNIEDAHIIGFGLSGITEADESLKNAMLLNVFSYMSDKLLNQRNTVAVLDEFYLFLSSMVGVVYTRNCMKRVRKYDSSVILASQNIEDFLNPNISFQTKPLLSIPTHKFLFWPGNVDAKDFMNLLQLKSNEYQLIQQSSRGHCLYLCGNERYSLKVGFPEYKTRLYGNGGGR